jgi:hypothetical protein
MDKVNATEDGEWLHLHVNDPLHQNNSELVLGASLCFTAFYPAEFEIEASAASNRTEIPWAGVLNGLDTSFDLRGQLGVLNQRQSLNDRGVMQLKGRKYWITDRAMPTTATYIYEAANAGWNIRGDYQPTTVRFFPDGPNSVLQDAKTPCLGVHPYHYRLFQYIIQDTCRPALALQAWFTTLFQMAYYDDIEAFNVTTPATQNLLVSTLIPIRVYGFTTVVSVLALHVFTVIIAVILFLLKTKFSMLGDSWCTMTQISAAETDSIYQQPGLIGDRRAKDLLKAEGKKNLRVEIERDSTSHRIGLKKLA